MHGMCEISGDKESLGDGGAGVAGPELYFPVYQQWDGGKSIPVR